MANAYQVFYGQKCIEFTFLLVEYLHLESGDHGVWRHLEGFSCARVHPPHAEVGCHASSNSVVWRCLLEYSVQRMLMRKYHLVSVATIDKVRVCSS